MPQGYVTIAGTVNRQAFCVLGHVSRARQTGAYRGPGPLEASRAIDRRDREGFAGSGETWVGETGIGRRDTPPPPEQVRGRGENGREAGRDNVGRAGRDQGGGV